MRFSLRIAYSEKKKQSILMQILWFQKDAWKGSDLPEGGGQSANFFSGGGVHHRDIFPVGSPG